MKLDKELTYVDDRNVYVKSQRARERVMRSYPVLEK